MRPVLSTALLVGLILAATACAKARGPGTLGFDDAAISDGFYPYGAEAGPIPDRALITPEFGALQPDALPGDLLIPDGCVPACAGKCKGASDGCGSTCTQTQCTGCCIGTTCQAGGEKTQCGKNGGLCQDCTVAEVCSEGLCQAGACVKNPRPNGTPCSGGKCYQGMCCTGCWDGGSCRGGISPTYCGMSGAPCLTCTTTNPCKSASCATGSCIISQYPFGSGCPSGKCLLGNCCTGCVSGSTCYPGNGYNYCGLGGGPCKQCWGGQSCTNGQCIN